MVEPRPQTLNAWAAMADPSNICERASISWPSVTTLRRLPATLRMASNAIASEYAFAPTKQGLNRMCEHIKSTGGSWVGRQTDREIWIKHRESRSNAWMQNVSFTPKPGIRDHARAIGFRPGARRCGDRNYRRCRRLVRTPASLQPYPGWRQVMQSPYRNPWRIRRQLA